MFADQVEIMVQAGKGGDGRLSFRSEKYRAKGGPDGGDGGRGGSVVFQVDHNLGTLSVFRRQKLIKAEDGQMGGTDRRHGKAGEDVVIKIPEGTQVYNGDELICDLTQDGQREVIAKGGRGGFGNAHFTSSVRQAPRTVEVGDAGEHLTVRLELKLVADVGLVGLPNAGKSTLLSVISNARPEIGDYPFTTIVPNLGVVDHHDQSFMTADIPGLIEGASRGKGLGDAFLRHIERTAVLIHLVDASSEDVTGDYQTIQAELQEYEVDLTTKPQIIALSKIDTVDQQAVKERQRALERASGQTCYLVSAVAHKGLDALLDAVWPAVKAAREQRAKAEEAQNRVVIDEASQPELWQVERHGKKLVVSGQKIEGFARRTNWDNDDSVRRLRDILRKTGVIKELEKQGIEEGEEFEIAGHALEWQE